MNYDLKIIQGNTKTYRIINESRDFAPGDKIIFTVKKNYSVKDELLQKEIISFEGNVAVINLSSNDTANISTGDYVYDIQYNSYDGIVKTIYKGNLIIDWRVTDDE